MSNNMDVIRYDAAAIIWDRDHGSGNEGWYLRTSQDGQEMDERLDALDDLPHDATTQALKSAAVLYLHDPDGMTDADREALRDMIEVKR